MGKIIGTACHISCRRVLMRFLLGRFFGNRFCDWVVFGNFWCFSFVTEFCGVSLCFSIGRVSLASFGFVSAGVVSGAGGFGCETFWRGCVVAKKGLFAYGFAYRPLLVSRREPRKRLIFGSFLDASRILLSTFGDLICVSALLFSLRFDSSVQCCAVAFACSFWGAARWIDLK